MLIYQKLELTDFPYKQDVFDYLTPGQDEVLNSKYNGDKKLQFTCPSCGVSNYKSLETILKGKGAYCRSCSRVHVVSKDRQLYENFPEVAKMFDDAENIEPYSKRNLSSMQVTYGSHLNYRFKCNQGHIFTSPVSDVVRSYKEGSKFLGCPYCSGVNTKLVSKIKDIVKNADTWWDSEKNNCSIEDAVYQKYSHVKYAWICPKGHSFFRSLDKINDNILTCPVCTGYKFQSGTNDIKTLVPQLVEYFDEEKNGIKASEAYWSKYSEKDYWWRCPKGHSFLRKPVNIDVNNFTCAVCRGKQVNMGVNDLQTLRPDIMKYWVKDNDIKPWNITVDSCEVASFYCIQCGDLYDTTITSRTRSRGLCPKCNEIYISSQGEEEIGDFLSSLGIEYECQAHIFKNKSKACDFYLPNQNLVIEYNGIYWHSEAGGKDRYYHYNRYKELKEKGISLIYVWEDEWVSNRELVERLLKRKIGISIEEKVNARDCGIYQELSEDIDDVRCFLNKYHIQGFKSGSLYLSLRDNNMNIVAIMVLQNKGNSLYEIARYATSCIVRGGFTKILSVLKSEYNIQKVQTFSDNGVSAGSLYKNSGFIMVEELKPDYCYAYKGTRVHKFNFRKESFKKRNLLYREGLSESELASLNNIAKIWDAGKKKWIKSL